MHDSIILTFDLEEWFHLCLDDDITSWNKYEMRFKGNMEYLLEILENNNTKATFLVLGWIAKKYPEIIKEIHKKGHDIGSHSYAHELIYNQSYSEFRNDLKKSKNILEDIISDEVQIYRAPAFSINNETVWALDILAENGIKYDLSLFQGKHSLGGISGINIDEPFFIDTNSGKILEYPITITNLLGISFATCGGGYFRLMPYTLIKKLLQERNYTMTYFHPRDFDYGQPRISMPLFKYFRIYTGLKHARKKFNTLLKNHKMMSLSMDLQERDMDKIRTIDANQLGNSN